MLKVCQDMHKCHNYHAILHKQYMWFDKNELRLILNRAKKISHVPFLCIIVVLSTKLLAVVAFIKNTYLLN